MKILHYSTVLELKEYYGNLRLTISTPNDLKTITERQRFFDEVHKGFATRVNAVIIPEGSSVEDSNAIKNTEANRLLLEDSGLTKEQMAIFTADEFVNAVKDLKLTNKEIGFLSYWFIKQE